MRTTAVFLALAIAYLAIEAMPVEVAGAIGLAFVVVIVAALIAAIISVGKRAN